MEFIEPKLSPSGDPKSTHGAHPRGDPNSTHGAHSNPKEEKSWASVLEVQRFQEAVWNFPDRFSQDHDMVVREHHKNVRNVQTFAWTHIIIGVIRLIVFGVATYFVVTWNREYLAKGQQPQYGLQTLGCCCCCTILALCFPIDPPPQQQQVQVVYVQEQK